MFCSGRRNGRETIEKSKGRLLSKTTRVDRKYKNALQSSQNVTTTKLKGGCCLVCHDLEDSGPEKTNLCPVTTCIDSILVDVENFN